MDLESGEMREGAFTVLSLCPPHNQTSLIAAPLALSNRFKVHPFRLYSPTTLD